MKKPLYIVWTQNQMVGIPIIDEQHHAIVSTINSLYFFINQDWGLAGLAPTLKIVKTNIGFHLKTEEGILEKMGANYKVLMKHNEIMAQFDEGANDALQAALSEQDPMILLKYLRKWWIGHHDEDHEEYEALLAPLVDHEHEVA